MPAQAFEKPGLGWKWIGLVFYCKDKTRGLYPYCELGYF